VKVIFGDSNVDVFTTSISFEKKFLPGNSVVRLTWETTDKKVVM